MMKKAVLACLSALLLFVLLPVVHAETPPPDMPFGDRWHATLKTKLATVLLLDKHQVELEKTRLSDVLAYLPQGRIAHRGDAGASAYWLCYTYLAPAQSTRLWLISDGEMGGDEHLITAIHARYADTPAATADCPELPDDMPPKIKDAAAGLDFPTSWMVVSAYGKPSFQQDGWQVWQRESKVRGNCKLGGYTRMNSVMMHFVDTPYDNKPRADQLWITQITSC